MLTTLKWLIILSISLGIGLSCLIAFADEIDNLVPFIIQIESSGNPNAVSSCGAIGLMQIMPVVVAEFHQVECEPYCSNRFALYDPETNKALGTWYLRRLKNHYLKDNYTVERMLSAYNGGITRLRRLLRQGKDWQDMPRESVNYVRKILKLYKNRDK